MNFKEEMKLTDEQLNMFNNYMNLLIEWNEKFNLTAITEKDEIILKHFVDSLTVEEFIPNGSHIIDIGTGAGFPGIPLKIKDDSLNVTLVDSLNKRVNFLNEVIKTLNLQNINALHGRAEDLGRDKIHREKYDIAISRAVANTATLSEYLLPLVKVGGYAIYMKGPNIEEELKEGEKAIEILGGKIENVHNFKLPDSDIERNIILVKKIKSTNLKYPRKAGVPAKEPIK
jgi:16S rRNA (guanine527-N7)-methyltransferase